jgi:hypothetical protein
MNEASKNKGPWAHRFLIVIFSVAMAILCFWLLGFVVDDIGNWPGPDYEKLEKQLLDPGLTQKKTRLKDQVADAKRQISVQNQRQKLLRDSTTSSQKTMNQLLEFQRLSLQKNVTSSAEEQQVLAESQRRFFANQKQYQSLNQAIVQLNERLTHLEDEQRDLNAEIERQQKPIQAKFYSLQDRHQFKIAVLKLTVLLPLLLLAVGLFFKFRGGTYALLIYAFGIAVVLKVALVMHQHFPSRYFKYVLILTALAIVVRILVYLLRMIAFPQKNWLLRQYREAYEFFLCPICSYPIRRGPLKYRFWTRRTLKKMPLPSSGEIAQEAAYTCPACSTQLHEKCPQCGEIRPSLLPTCQSCGQTENLKPATAP